MQLPVAKKPIPCRPAGDIKVFLNMYHLFIIDLVELAHVEHELSNVFGKLKHNVVNVCLFSK